VNSLVLSTKSLQKHSTANNSPGKMTPQMKNGKGLRRKRTDDTEAEPGPANSSKKQRSLEQPRGADHAGAAPPQSTSRLEIPQAAPADQQSPDLTNNKQKRKPRPIGPKGSTPPPRSPGNSSTYSDSAEMYDVPPNFEPEGRVAVDDPHQWKRKKGLAAKFIHSASGIGSTWIGKRPLGAGAFGIAGLWEKYDNDGKLIDVSLEIP